MLQQVHSTGMNLHIKNAHLYITMPCLLIGKIRLYMQIFKAHYLFDRSLYQIFSAVVFSNPSSNLPWNSTSCILYCRRCIFLKIEFLAFAIKLIYHHQQSIWWWLKNEVSNYAKSFGNLVPFLIASKMLFHSDKQRSSSNSSSAWRRVTLALNAQWHHVIILVNPAAMAAFMPIAIFINKDHSLRCLPTPYQVWTPFSKYMAVCKCVK